MATKKSAAKKQPALSKAEKALADFEAKFSKTFGEGTLVADEAEVPYQVIPTGSITLDYYLGVGGWVRGRLAEIWGGDDIGKTTLMLQSVREAQRVAPDQLVLWIDMEQKWDWDWARTHGVDTHRSRFKLYTPESAEDVADAIKEALRSGLFSLIVLDSIGAMIPEVEKEKDADAAVIATQAKIITRMVKIAAVEAKKTNTAVVMINQVRANVSGFGKATMTGGGFALRHCSTHKIEMKRTGAEELSVQEDGVKLRVGHEIACFIDRNKVAKPKRTAFITLVYSETDKYGPVGFDKADEAASMGVKTGVIAQNGGWYTFSTTGERVQGRDKVLEILRNDPEQVDQVRDRILASLAGEIISDEGPDIEAAEAEEKALDTLLEGTALFGKKGEPDPNNPDGVTLPNLLKGDS